MTTNTSKSNLGTQALKDFRDFIPWIQILKHHWQHLEHRPTQSWETSYLGYRPPRAHIQVCNICCKIQRDHTKHILPNTSDWTYGTQILKVFKDLTLHSDPETHRIKSWNTDNDYRDLPHWTQTYHYLRNSNLENRSSVCFETSNHWTHTLHRIKPWDKLPQIGQRSLILITDPKILQIQTLEHRQ